MGIPELRNDPLLTVDELTRQGLGRGLAGLINQHYRCRATQLSVVGVRRLRTNIEY